MDEIVTPDEDGGIEPGTAVSYIVIPAKKGLQAAAVTEVTPPGEKKEDAPATGIESSFAQMDVSISQGANAGWGDENKNSDAGWDESKGADAGWGENQTTASGWGGNTDAGWGS